MIAYLQKKLALSEQGARDLLAGCAASLLQNIAHMFPIAVLYEFIRRLMCNDMAGLTGMVFLLASAGCLAIFVLTLFQQYNATFLATYRESARRRTALAEKLRRIPQAFFEKKDLADLSSTIMSDCAFLEKVFSHFVPGLAGSVLSTLLIGAALFFIDYRMACAALWVVPIAFAVIALSGRVQDRLQKRQMQARTQCADGIQECIETIRDLTSCNAQDRYLQGLDEKIRKVEKTAAMSEFGMSVFMVASGMILKLGLATTALTGASLLVAGRLDILTFFMFVLVVSRLYDPLQESMQNLMAIIIARTSLARIREIMEFPEQGGTDALTCQGYDIVFDHVRFSYDGRKDVLEDVSFVARQGEVTALIGASGSGKTTITRLAARFWDVSGGSITIGGMDIAKVDPERLLSLVSIVFQDVTLFNNTVLENIRMGRKDATDEEVKACAALAHVDRIVERLPDRWNTFIGENGSALSGGERQRISIARAFLKNAPILLLDEATASLDVENETLIQDALARLVRNRTVLVIAHRMRTVAGSDQIVVLKDGRVAESGTPEELMQRNGLAAATIRRQLESSSWTLPSSRSTQDSTQD